MLKILTGGQSYKIKKKAHTNGTEVVMPKRAANLGTSEMAELKEISTHFYSESLKTAASELCLSALRLLYRTGFKHFI